ncbi:MAG: response regulator [Myxococcota bacterium]|jgi:CheY-like chemotaxis protein|nr:response regulator [Myxococcota bacterium]
MAKTILVADDSRTVQEVVRLALQGEGYELAAASSGVAALRLAQELRPALVLADLRMPEGDGSWLIRQLRADPGLAKVPAVLLHPGNEPAPERLATESGASGLLAKPFLSAELTELCRRLLQPAPRDVSLEQPRVHTPETAVAAGLARTATPSLAERISRMEEVLGRRGGAASAGETIAFGAPRTISTLPAPPAKAPEPAPPQAEAVLDALRQAGKAFQKAKPPARASSLPGPGGVTVPIGPPLGVPASVGRPEVSPAGGAGTKTQAFRSFTPAPSRVPEPAAPARPGLPVAAAPARPGLPVAAAPARPALGGLTQPLGSPPAVGEVPRPASLPADAPPRATPGGARLLTREDLLDAVRQVAREAVERAIWELVPDLAEKILWEVVPEVTETLVREKLEAADPH